MLPHFAALLSRRVSTSYFSPSSSAPLLSSEDAEPHAPHANEAPTTATARPIASFAGVNVLMPLTRRLSIASDDPGNTYGTILHGAGLYCCLISAWPTSRPPSAGQILDLVRGNGNGLTRAADTAEQARLGALVVEKEELKQLEMVYVQGGAVVGSRTENKMRGGFIMDFFWGILNGIVLL